ELFSLAGVRASVVAHPVPVVTAVGRDAARRELGLPGDGVLLGALGFVRPYKGYDLLADVWERIGETGPSVLVMGEQLEPGQTDVLQRLGRAPRAIVRLGYVEHRELALAVEACDAVLLPYVGGSDSGILHLARSLRTPTIASDSPQLASSVLANRCGTVVPRDPEAWLAAVTGELPAAPAPAPAPSATGQAHLRVYATALRSRGGR
ncbi:MAG: glycosyltransferase, partial [Gaiellales bacterium]